MCIGAVRGQLVRPRAPLFLWKSIAFVSHHLNVISVDSTDSCHFVKVCVTEVWPACDQSRSRGPHLLGKDTPSGGRQTPILQKGTKGSCCCLSFAWRTTKPASVSWWALLILVSYSCSPPLPRPRPAKYCGLRRAVSKTPTVMKIPASNMAWTIALTPNT